MKILFLSANPQSTVRLAIDEEFRAIMEKIRRSSGQEPMLEIVTAWAARPDDLLQSLNEHQPEIVHFSGHGNLDGISLVGENGKSKLVSTKALVSLFKSFSNCTKLVVLNSCYSKSQAKAINKVIDYVVGMKDPISDLAAITFSASFYRALSFQKTFVEAFEQARTALLLESINEEWTPTLLVRQGISEPENMASLNSATYLLESERITNFLKIFNRPAFIMPCVIELWMEELATAIDDVQTAINTGRLYSRDGKFLGEVPEGFSFSNPEFQKILIEITQFLIRLKGLISKFIIEFKNKYPEYYVVNSREAYRDYLSFFSMSQWLLMHEETDFLHEIIQTMDEIDKNRNEILSRLNKLLSRTSEKSMNMIELSSEVIRKGNWNGFPLMLPKGFTKYLY